MSYRLSLHHPSGVTSVVVGAGALAEAADELGAWAAGRTLFVVSTPRVVALHGAALDPTRAAAARTVTLEVEDGEGAKSLATAERLWSEMLAAGGKRDSRVLAFGGGSCGDVAGFAAGCFLRGVGLVQVPTTLLGQVDAALGGKTAVDLPAAKNSVGLFHHPALVVADTRLLATLPPGELRSGLVEVIKMAFLLEPELLGRIETDLDRLLEGDPEALAPVVAEAAAAKIAVVEADPEERGRRRLLNFGHTFGHALEAALGYRGLRHGEAVAYGMLFALRLARSPARTERLPAEDSGRLRALLERLDLPPLPALPPEELLAAMARDKKAREEGLLWVLPARLGEGRVLADVGEAETRRELAAFLDAPWA
ncbi:MAG TPA: 3-dehydroquinate synthase family protein [Thermoanaerobaculia bacterium]|nr:3-dehydroquinate synthase family protein [Thermoanaerobaculia bacterium]